MTKKKEQKIKDIAINKINILNPRIRNQRMFRLMVQNIEDVGLKRPIMLRKGSAVEGKQYDLICGQGRMEAFQILGKKTIPAIIVNINEEEALIMSLVENIARRLHRAMDLLQGIEILLNQGYDCKSIAEKTGLAPDYTKDIIFLLENGEQRLLRAVENGSMPITVAIKIAESPNEEVQQALQDAYDDGLLRGQKLIQAKKLLELRKRFGKSTNGGGAGSHRNRGSKKVTAREVLKIYEKEATRKRLLTRKAHATGNTMVFLTEAFDHLLQDKEFRGLLQSEQLTEMPKPLAELCASK